jgi:hypothetical protein
MMKMAKPKGGNGRHSSKLELIKTYLRSTPFKNIDVLDLFITVNTTIVFLWFYNDHNKQLLCSR